MTVDPAMLEAVVRDHLNLSAPRTMVVLDPLKVTILGCDRTGPITVPDFPNEPERGSHAVQFGAVIYIEQSDFKRVGEKGYRRLCPGQPVGLRYAGYVITLEEVVEKDGQVMRVFFLDVKDSEYLTFIVGTSTHTKAPDVMWESAKKN